jgi:AcrR family transcriptional regulator
MKVKKDDTYKSILLSARKEFVNKGFKEASMRSIAKNANVGLSNIYNYFQNKDEIFLVMVKPAKEKLFTFISNQHTQAYVDFESMSPFGHDEEAIDFYIDLIFKYKEEYRLLLYHSQGSSMENFRDMLTDHMTQVSYIFMKLEKQYFPKAEDISDFFIHAMSSWMVSILGEFVTHELDKHKIRDFFREYFRFSFAGWRELIAL